MNRLLLPLLAGTLAVAFAGCTVDGLGRNVENTRVPDAAQGPNGANGMG